MLSICIERNVVLAVFLHILKVTINVCTCMQSRCVHGCLIWISLLTPAHTKQLGSCCADVTVQTVRDILLICFISRHKRTFYIVISLKWQQLNMKPKTLEIVLNNIIYKQVLIIFWGNLKWIHILAYLAIRGNTIILLMHSSACQQKNRWAISNTLSCRSNVSCCRHRIYYRVALSRKEDHTSKFVNIFYRCYNILNYILIQIFYRESANNSLCMS